MRATALNSDPATKLLKKSAPPKKKKLSWTHLAYYCYYYKRQSTALQPHWLRTAADIWDLCSDWCSYHKAIKFTCSFFFFCCFDCGVEFVSVFTSEETTTTKKKKQLVKAGHSPQFKSYSHQTLHRTHTHTHTHTKKKKKKQWRDASGALSFSRFPTFFFISIRQGFYITVNCNNTRNAYCRSTY